MKFTPQKRVEQLFSSTFICGAGRSGKTNHAMNIARALMEADVILLIIDPTKTWMNNFELIENILTIKNATLPSIDWDKHYIVDTSGLDAEEQQNFTEKFCRAIMDVAAKNLEQKKKRMVIFEECHTPVPSMSLRSKKRGNTQRMLTQGRHFGINFIAITQFPMTTDETFIKVAEPRYFFRLDKKSDKAYAKEFIGSFADELSTLKRGECFYNSGNKVSREITPKFGERLLLPTIKSMEEGFPELVGAIRESPIKFEENKRKNSRYYGRTYMFHIYPFGEAGSTVEPTLVKEIVQGLIKKINELNQSFDYIVCLGAGDKWASHVGTVMNKRFRRITERESGLPGEEHLHLDTILYEKDLYFRDFKAGDKVILIDDVISTGETSEEIIKTLNKMGVKVVGAFCIVAKGNGHRRLEEKLGVPVRYLYQYFVV